MAFHEWLRNVRTDHEYFPDFFFPSNNAGPDIVFALERQRKQNKEAREEEVREIVLCAIQVSEPDDL